jgi:N-carbamoyl-L-amino-acid hydrolase
LPELRKLENSINLNAHPENLRINAQRFQQDFEALSQLGSTGDGGVHRPTFSPAYLAARAWLKERILQAGLDFSQDTAGNHSARLSCGPSSAPTLLLGSHLDSVPNGGRFDGASGVLAALETLRTIREAGIRLPFNLEAIDFTDEEGTLSGLLGSSALAGKLTPEELETPRGGREALLAGLSRAGLSETGLLQARREPSSLAGYLELHIEQGPTLWRAGIQIGVVSSITGIGSYWLKYKGKADHAGTTPLPDRLDAGRGAAAFHQAVWPLLEETFPDCIANIGEFNLLPGAFNIVPGEAVLALEYRAPEPGVFAALEDALLNKAQAVAAELGLGLIAEPLGKHLPTPLHPIAQGAITRAAETLGLSHMPVPSSAGHDGQSLADLCPVGMIFVPSVEGASHSAREFTEWVDCVDGANVLLQAVLMFNH